MGGNESILNETSNEKGKSLRTPLSQNLSRKGVIMQIGGSLDGL